MPRSTGRDPGAAVSTNPMSTISTWSSVVWMTSASGPRARRGGKSWPDVQDPPVARTVAEAGVGDLSVQALLGGGEAVIPLIGNTPQKYPESGSVGLAGGFPAISFNNSRNVQYAATGAL
ncbi:hypothetical protein NYO91_14015 [Arhodomonas aquaeolei]|uniref:hypothetical protein n=1 Tax=Arhodomonas aquaeolei TaxID=2369 RepID=UPI002169E34C|nr:hypothetical protein [Arhodomonas aquaeolei]MCS4505197.1 hypothetical protein [Arhodomonas aquaeolei]